MLGESDVFVYYFDVLILFCCCREFFVVFLYIYIYRERERERKKEKKIKLNCFMLYAV